MLIYKKKQEFFLFVFVHSLNFNLMSGFVVLFSLHCKVFVLLCSTFLILVQIKKKRNFFSLYCYMSNAASKI